jgi:hypothetical protein
VLTRQNKIVRMEKKIELEHEDPHIVSSLEGFKGDLPKMDRFISSQKSSWEKKNMTWCN